MNADLQAALDNLTASVSEIPSIEDSIESTFTQLSQMIADLKNTNTDPAALAAIASATEIVNATAARAKAAITANTPAAPSA